MIENVIKLLEGAQYRLRVKLTNEAGELLPPELYRVYAGAYCPGCTPAHFQAERTAEEWVLTMPGLKPGRVPWNWQVIAAEYATGVEWLLAAGEVNVTPRLATGSGYVDPGELMVTATLDKTTLQMTVQLGESTAACSLAVVDARQSAAAAAASAQASATSAGESAASAGAAADSAHEADGRANDASASAADAQTYAGQAAGCVTEAAEYAAEAATSAIAAANSAVDADRHSADAAASSKAAADSASDAATSSKAAADGASDAIQASENADAASQTATQKATEAANSASQAAADKTAAETAKTEAQAAKTKAEQEAAKAEQNAALLGDAALKGADNTFSGNNTFTANIIGGLMQLPAQSLAAIYYAALHWWNNEFDWYKAYAWDKHALSIFPNLTHFLPGTAEPDWTRLQAAQGYLTDCPIEAIPEGWTGAGLTRKGNGGAGDGTFWDGAFFKGSYLPETWLTPDLVYANGMYTGAQFATLPEGTTFENVTMLASCFRDNKKIRRFPSSLNLRQVTNASDAFRDCPALEELPETLTGEHVVDFRGLVYGCKKITTANNIVGSRAWSWWNAFRNCSSLREMHNVDCSSAVTCDGAWSSCQLDKESALRILTTIPALSDEDYTIGQWVDGAARKLDIGIHRDLRQDADILAALELAALPKAEGGKGWQTSVQWNGTAGALSPSSASTYGMREVIYARAIAMDGEAVLEWAHSVLSPDGQSPEELGYETFRSLAAAREYFGLPEEDLTETE